MNVVKCAWFDGLMPRGTKTWPSIDLPCTCTSLDNIHVGYRSIQTYSALRNSYQISIGSDDGLVPTRQRAII